MVEDRNPMIVVIPDSIRPSQPEALLRRSRLGNPENPKLDSRFRGNDKEERVSTPQAQVLQKRFLKFGYKFCSSLLLPVLIVFLAPACRRNNQSSAPAAAPLMETISSGPIELTFMADPAAVHLDRDILLTIRVCAPSNMEVRLPPLGNRLKGFVINGDFTRDGQTSNGQPAREYCFRLTPTLADEYRIAPMAITWINRAREPHSEGWFATRPIIFQAVAVAKGLPAATIHDITGPVWIYPPFKTVALWTLAIACLAGVFFLLRWLSRRIHKAIQLRRMSPRERALYELNELLERDLIGRQQIKEFYLELTMIVRRYIERAHRIRAPEQTTEEFLNAAAENPEFSRQVVIKLRKFLQTADLVKFAAYRPERTVIDQAILTARDYIETDEKTKQDGDSANRLCISAVKK